MIFCFDNFGKNNGAGFFVTTQYSLRLRWLHQKAGLSRFGLAGCLTELGIVHQGVARQKIAHSCLCCATR